MTEPGKVLLTGQVYEKGGKRRMSVFLNAASPYGKYALKGEAGLLDIEFPE